jgi:2-polyprenyl-6-methoxyphenol hydroxylase-like FAD-dependent oxidoreductase
MKDTSNFKILIAGGGIAGLTLANMLERFDIDYILLESQKEITPQVGASIGLLPNGLRILDQIGCYEPIRKYLIPESHFHLNDPNGRSLFTLPDFLKQLEAR